MACNKTIKYNNILKKISYLKNSFLNLVLSIQTTQKTTILIGPNATELIFFLRTRGRISNNMEMNLGRHFLFYR